MKAGADDREAMASREPRLFNSFFLGGFECSTHRIASGKRLDLVASTGHDRFCELDYKRLVELGIRVAREGLRWHLIESQPGIYDFRTAEPMVNAARRQGIQLIWDLCHYGWPDDLDIFSAAFPSRFAQFAQAFGRWIRERETGPVMITPINEISFIAWAGGDAAVLPPRCHHRGFELKAQLVRSAVLAMEALRVMIPDVRFFQVDPIINVIADPRRRSDRPAARARSQGQYQAWDMLAGRHWPQLGGEERNLDIIGLNYYPHNQWIVGRKFIRRDHPLYRPLRKLLQTMFERYQRPLIIAETGCEDADRPGWLRYVCREVEAAMKHGIPIHGICLYPILNHPGWNDDRHCHNGLWDYPDKEGNREIYEPLAEELRRWQPIFENVLRRS
jgi:beta-glucosidase/6-phospho-beta-glucosidase/beta-galactosidase